MGKQITFFMLKADESTFLKTIYENNDMLISSKGQVIPFEVAVNSNEPKFFIISKESKIIIKDNGFVDSLRSDVIEFLRSSVKNQLVNYGRIWTEYKYLDEYGNTINKDIWLSKKFDMYKKWITKNLKRSKCKGYYIGSEAYNRYMSGEYNMMATPVLKVDFS